MKRLGISVAAILGVAVVVLSGLISMSRLLDHDALRNAVESQIRTVTGLDFVADGRIDVSVFPGSYVSFHGVRIKGSDAEAPALSVDVLTANLRLIPLLMQHFQIDDVMMLHPHIRVKRAADD